MRRPCDHIYCRHFGPVTFLKFSKTIMLIADSGRSGKTKMVTVVMLNVLGLLIPWLFGVVVSILGRHKRVTPCKQATAKEPESVLLSDGSWSYQSSRLD